MVHADNMVIWALEHPDEKEQQGRVIPPPKPANPGPE